MTDRHAGVSASTTKAGHTPGPWTVGEPERDVVFAGNQRIAVCSTYTAPDEDAPNAALLARAEGGGS